jgi:hypothetical protein
LEPREDGLPLVLEGVVGPDEWSLPGGAIEDDDDGGAGGGGGGFGTGQPSSPITPTRASGKSQMRQNNNKEEKTKSNNLETIFKWGSYSPWCKGGKGR